MVTPRQRRIKPRFMGEPPTRMIFHVWSTSVTVIISPGRLHDGASEETFLCLPENREVYLSPALNAADRLYSLTCAIRLMWIRMEPLTGESHGTFEDDRREQLFAHQLAADLDANGGEDALVRMLPAGTITKPRPNIALDRWKRLGVALREPDIELDFETFAPLMATFTQLRNAGYDFDPTLAALMGALKRQAFSHDGEEDHDITGCGGPPRHSYDTEGREVSAA